MQRPAEVPCLCQGKLCKNFTRKTLAVKVCHHRDCQNTNNQLPLVLCLDCDKVTHAGISKNHARFELKGNRSFEKMSSSKIAESDSGAEDDQEPVVTSEKEKAKSQSTRKRFMKLPDTKKKPRRHNTDNPSRGCIRLKIYSEASGDFSLELIPALKGKTLKESLDPILEKYHINFESHSVFLDASNTPLPLAFESYPLSGNILHIRDNSCVKVDKRVRDISKNFESKPQPEPSVSRTPSFSKRNQKLEEKEKEKEGTGKEDDKESEDSLKKGKKNTSSLPGDSEERNQGSVSSGAGKEGKGGKPAGILTGLFTGNPAIIVKGKELSTVRSLPEILQYFTVHGLENESKSTANNEQEFYLEDSWTKIVEDSENLDKKDRDRQEAIWELLSTEVAYINKLQVIKKIFILCLRNIQNEGYLQELELPNLFSNIEEIYAVNVSFWLSSLKPVMNMARHSKKLLNPFYMADGLSTFDSQFEPYVKYCIEESSCLRYLKQKRAEDELFKLYVEWCESRPECKRLKLSDLLMKPVQRVTKYPLLLKAILKKTVQEDKRKELIAMIKTAEKFVGKVNASMKIRHEKDKLNYMAVKIESYWPVDPVTDEVEKFLIDNYCDFDLSRPMPGAPREQHRCLLHQGSLRLSEKQGKIQWKKWKMTSSISSLMDVHAFLFTDMVLLTKLKKTEKFKVVKPPLRIDKVKIHELKDPGTFLLVYLNEYRTVVHAFVLQSSDRAKWIEMFDKAKNLYQAVLQSDGSRCLTADDAGVQSPATTPSQSPTARNNRNSWKISSESLDQASLGVPMVTVTSTAPGLRGHLSGSDGNLSLLGLSEQSTAAASGLSRRSSYNERKSKSKHDNSRRRPRADSKVMRSTSDPYNKHLREDAQSGLSRSSSVPQAPRPITEKMSNESSVDLESPQPTTSISEIDLSECVDVDEIQMSLSPDVESPRDSPRTETAKNVTSQVSNVASESDRPSSDVLRGSAADTTEKLKQQLALKLGKGLSSKRDGEKVDDSSRDTTKRSPRSHSERKRLPRSSSVERARKSGERRAAVDVGSVLDPGALTSPSESKSADGRKTKLARSSSSGSRQLPDPNQISGKQRPPRKSQEDGISERTPNPSVELNGLSQDPSDSLESARTPGGSQAPPIKAPLIAGLLGRNGSNGSDVPRKRTPLPKRSSPVMHRKPPPLDGAMRKSMDEQLLEPKRSPPLRRAKSEADTPLETLRTKSKNSEGTSRAKSGTGSEERTRSRTSRSSVESESTGRSSLGDTSSSGSTKSGASSQESRGTNSHGVSVDTTASAKEQEGGEEGKSHAGEKPRRQIKKYRGRDSRRLVDGDGGVVVCTDGNVNDRHENLRHVVEPIMLESSEYV